MTFEAAPSEENIHLWLLCDWYLRTWRSCDPSANVVEWQHKRSVAKNVLETRMTQKALDEETKDVIEAMKRDTIEYFRDTTKQISPVYEETFAEEVRAAEEVSLSSSNEDLSDNSATDAETYAINSSENPTHAALDLSLNNLEQDQDHLTFSEDSPMFRVRLQALEQSTTALKRYLKHIVNMSKHFRTSGMKLNRATSEFAQSFTPGAPIKQKQHPKLSLKGKIEQDPEALRLKNWYNAVGDLLPVFEQLHDQMAQFDMFFGKLVHQNATLLTNPLEELVETEFQQIKQAKKKYMKHSVDYENGLHRFLHASQTAVAAASGARPTLPLPELRKRFEVARFELVHLLNDLQAKKRVHLLKSLLASMDSFHHFFRQGYEILRSVETLRNQFEEDLHRNESMYHHFVCQWQTHRDDLMKQFQPSHMLSPVASPIAGKQESKGKGKGISILKQGYVFLRTRPKHTLRQWQRIWLILEAATLSYLPSCTGLLEPNPSLDPQLLCHLNLCSVRPSSEWKFGWEIWTADNQQHLLQAETLEEAQEWQYNLQNSIGSALEQPQQKKAWDPLVQQLLVDNPSCADCDTLAPDWCSLNLGILICIECSGIHRSLGVHVSKVRSLTLDKLSPSEAEVVKVLGNKHSNSIYERLAPTEAKPGPKASREEKQKWIEQKYKHRRFVERNSGNASEELYRATQTGDIVGMHSALAQNAQVNYIAREDKNHTPLHRACADGNLICVDLLVLNGADVDALDAEQCTPVDAAMLNNHLELLNYFFKKPANDEDK